MKLAIIVAKARNGVIGVDNKLPWHLPADLKYFKQVTFGKPVIMGRLTFESIGRPLPGRANIVVTRNPDWSHAGVQAAASLEEAIDLAQAHCDVGGADEAMVIGGAQIYAQAMTLVQRIYLTEVQADIDGDARFPALDQDQWREVERADFAAQDPNPYDYSLRVLERA
ncbi:dihydrofolate reductase [Marinobacterium rhizophilum]|uniref:Dihydrofolate reductase n=1 Tax=Marinobacterium rhizophilum TaxID=420402 RepID=A0ABY5HFK0_9GAMM|nr:dihydrofolate reductase [Marinobacterium rhizophilum]UTW11018.1 dihydrofolate reductase [Marinobacterium rhizophilum]